MGGFATTGRRPRETRIRRFWMERWLASETRDPGHLWRVFQAGAWIHVLRMMHVLWWNRTRLHSLVQLPCPNWFRICPRSPTVRPRFEGCGAFARIKPCSPPGHWADDVQDHSNQKYVCCLKALARPAEGSSETVCKLPIGRHML